MIYITSNFTTSDVKNRKYCTSLNAAVYTDDDGNGAEGISFILHLLCIFYSIRGRSIECKIADPTFLFLAQAHILKAFQLEDKRAMHFSLSNGKNTTQITLATSTSRTLIVVIATSNTMSDSVSKMDTKALQLFLNEEISAYKRSDWIRKLVVPNITIHDDENDEKGTLGIFQYLSCVQITRVY
jgi:hypothetical protein